MIEYIGKKVVHAEYMNECEAVELGYARPNEDNHEWRKGYHVVYEDGYHSWSPKNVFEAAYKPCETFLERLHIEAEELAEKQAKLNEFIGSDKFKDLSWEHQKLLEAQFGAMLSYLTILQVRIELLTPTHTCCDCKCSCNG
jgi:hypothetical protein